MLERKKIPAEVADATPSIPPEICIGLLSKLILTDASHRPSRSHKPLPPAPRTPWQQSPRTSQLAHLYGIQAEKKHSQ